MIRIRSQPYTRYSYVNILKLLYFNYWGYKKELWDVFLQKLVYFFINLFIGGNNNWKANFNKIIIAFYLIKIKKNQRVLVVLRIHTFPSLLIQRKNILKNCIHHFIVKYFLDT